MSGTKDRKNPQLPQDASPDDQESRARAVASARKTYTWTTAVATLPGVPLAAKVPEADEPDLPWLLDTAEVAIAVVENVLANKAAEAEGVKDEHTAKLTQIKESVAQIRQNHEAATQSPGSLSDLFHAAIGGVGALLGTHGGTVRRHLDDLADLAEANTLGPRAAADLGAFRDLFRTLPLPAVADTFQEDATFARMRVAGPNAGLIARVTALPAKFPLSEADYASVMGGGDTIAKAIADKRLYLVDYVGLDGMVAGTVDGKQKYLPMPIAAFAVPEGGRSLVPVAIQCGQDPASHPIHLRPKERDWGWEMAKFLVQVADGNYHELFAHLARTHLVVEAFAVACHRALAPSHPLYLLLIPHVQGTLFINNSAAGGLIAAGGPIEAIFAGTIDSIQLAAANDRLAFPFQARMLPTDLAARGVDDAQALPDYPYRDDATLVWKALGAWIHDYVATYYVDDEAVVADTELAAFCAEVRGSGQVKDFPLIASRETLVDALTMMIFTGSAQHAAVNFPQQTDMTWVPNVTGSAWAPGPDGVTPDEQAWFALMPTVDLALQQLNTLWLLGGVHFRKLGDYLDADFPYHAWFLDPKITREGGPLDRFRKSLREVEAAIERNNAGRDVPYTFLQPSLVPESINI
ncbi:MAG TPA: lipoxygenase family protein [Myxococcota bacterium]|nr:lipoxygenase family protein [Myxococcota bacterium]